MPRKMFRSIHKTAQVAVLGALTCLVIHAQADQIGRKEDKKPAFVMPGATPVDQAAADRGKKLYEPACGFCHGLDARGKSGPDLLRSTLVLHDDNGNQIGPVIRAGRPERGMPPFATMTKANISDIATFLHAGTSGITNRFAYEIKGLLTGDAKQGEAFFNGDGKCNTCHSVTGDLEHIASKYEPAELQRRFLYPAPNMIDVLLGKKVKPPSPSKVKVTLPSGETVSGTLVHADEFTVVLNDGQAQRSFARDENTKVVIEDPLAPHEAMLPKYTDQQMHNMLAYLETLK
jgi:cytochrome c oxidase cbb3-type subunit III